MEDIEQTIVEIHDEEGVLTQRQSKRGTVMDGETTTYYPDGKVWEKITYKDGKIHGDYVTFDEEGTLISHCRYENSKLNGVSEYYLLGRLHMKADYKDGKAHGLMVFYHDTGYIQSEAEYVEGKRNGRLLTYDVEQNLLSVTHFENDIKQGKKISYYPSGELYEEAIYKDDLLQGRQTYYYEDGPPRMITDFDKGIALEVPTLYDSYGREIVVGT